MTHRRLAALALLFLAGCPQRVSPEAPTSPQPSPMPSTCVAPPVVSDTPRGTSTPDALACVEEALTDGCPATRAERTFDEAGRLVRERFTVLDPALVEPSFSRVVSFEHRVERDAAGRPVREARDLEVDGTIDEEITRSYDAAGVLRVEVRTERGPESPGGVTRTEYDGAGRVTLRSHRVGRFSEATRTEYDRSGEPVRVESLVNDALVDRTVWTRRPDGAPVSRVRARVNGAVLEESRWTRDADGRLVSLTERDLPRGDGTFERSVVTRYDAQGRVIQRAEDHPHDGTPDAVTDTRYDAAGRKVWERVALEGATGSESSWTWDSAGRLLTEVVNDARGRTETRVEYAPDGTGIWAQRSGAFTLVRSLDARGNVLLEEHDLDSNGVVDRRTRMEYDAQGRMTRYALDGDADGALEATTVWSRDAAGNLLRTVRTMSDLPTYESRHAYDCLPR